MHGKLVVALRGAPDTYNDSYVPVVLCDTDDRVLGQALQPYEVSADEAHGFDHETILDCRWVFSLARSHFRAETFRFRLPAVTMDLVSVALTVGLQL